MEMIFLGLVVSLFVLATFDLIVGVSNDAVNFLNSAIGAKVARFRTVIIVASLGVLAGALLSNGMMDIARHGIFRPEMYSFENLMCIFLAVMVTDVILLDIFNSLGMPTSTTVSMVFELLGGTFVLALLKIVADDTGTLTFAHLLNTEKALSVILGIFCSVAIAFFFGTVVQWLTRLVFTFDYRRHLKYFIGVFGGVACTAIGYFILVKGLGQAAFMDDSMKQWIADNTHAIIIGGLVFFTVLMQSLHAAGGNVLKLIVLIGTFALAMAFASNDLVNFIGVPLAGYSAYSDFAANGHGDPDTFMMGSLNGSAHTPFVFLLASGMIMIYSLATSKKARNVVKTSVDLSRQDEGEEMFGSSSAARSMVRSFNTVSDACARVVPAGMRRWIDGRFSKEGAVLEDGAAFDLVRASVNIVLAALLIIMGTSLKLPLSTTYVTFIVAMGTSLADRAWSRESAVFRITGMLSVIGGWLITAGAAFLAAGTVVLVMHFGGIAAMIGFGVLAVVLLIRNNMPQDGKDSGADSGLFLRKLMQTQDKEERWSLLKDHLQAVQTEAMVHAGACFDNIVSGMINENLKQLRKAIRQLDRDNDSRKKTRHRLLVGMRSIDRTLSLEKNTWFHLAMNADEQIIYCLKRMATPCKEHVDNNFTPLNNSQIAELQPVKERVIDFIRRGTEAIERNDVEEIDRLLAEKEGFKRHISALRKRQMDYLQEHDSNINTTILYLNILQETQEFIASTRRILRSSKRFNN